MNQNKLKYEIPQYVVNNILLFLDRAKIDGAEAIALVEAKNILANPIKDEQPKES